MSTPEQPISLRRGLGVTEFVGTERHYFLRAGIERAGEVLVQYLESVGSPVFLRRDAYGRRINPAGIAGPNILFQLAAHPWTGALHLGPASHTPAAPREVSRLLDSQVLVLGHAAQSSTTYYELFDAGTRVEDFYSTPGDPHPRFRSSRRQVGPSDPNDPPAFIDAAFKSLDAYVYHAPIDYRDERDDEANAIYTLADPEHHREDYARIDLLLPR
jgi:hypothetical protein